MRHIKLAHAVLVVGLALMVAGPLLDAIAEVSGFEVSFHPPGLLLRGEDVTLSALAESSTSGEVSPRGYLYVRSDLKAAFTRLDLSGSTNMTARVPAALLTGSLLESYVVVTDRVSGTVLTVPAAGPDGPFRSWILDDPPTVSIGKHRFGQIRAPDAVVVQASVGKGPGQIGITCPPEEGPCDTPQSFDVALDGTVWVADEANSRLEAWAPGEPGTWSRTIPLSVAPADVAVGPDGTIYVWGAAPGVGMRLYAFAPDGTQRWMAPLLSDIFNDHIRIGPEGALYIRSSIWGWVPAVDGDGQPLNKSEQRLRALRDQPVSSGRRLVITAGCALDPGCESPSDARVGLATPSGSLQEAWRITSSSVLVDEPEDVTPATVDGEPVVVSAVYDFEKHLKEFVVMRLSANGGIADRFSLGRGVLRGDLVVTGIRVGPDGEVYQMQMDVQDPKAGMRIARYSLAGSATPPPTSSPAPTSLSSPTPSTSAPTPTTVSSPTEPPEEVPGSGWAPAVWAATSLGSLGLIGGLLAFLRWRRRPRPTTVDRSE
jgi:hypothetical protein